MNQCWNYFDCRGVSAVLTPFGLSCIADATRRPLQKRNKLSMSRRQYLTDKSNDFFGGSLLPDSVCCVRCRLVNMDHRLPTQTLQDLGFAWTPKMVRQFAVFDPFDPKYGWCPPLSPAKQTFFFTHLQNRTLKLFIFRVLQLASLMNWWISTNHRKTCVTQHTIHQYQPGHQ